MGEGDAGFADLAGDLLARGLRARFRARGTSMGPTIRDGDLLTIDPCDAARIREGEIILIRAARGLTAHRVIRVEPGIGGSPILRTRGDAQDQCDPPARAQDILGRVVAVERHGRTIDLAGKRARGVWAARWRAKALKRRFLRAAAIGPNAEDRFAPETRLLLACARTHIDARGATAIQGLARGPIDWEALIATARAQCVMPLLYRAIADHAPDLASESAIAEMRAHFCASARHNLLLAEELIEILGLLERHGIPAIPLRGPALAEALYGDVALRHFRDLDVLVRRRDFERAGELVGGRGFRPLHGAALPADVIFFRAERTFVREPGRMHLDLHWAIEREYFPSASEPASLWRRAERATLEGRETLSLSAEDLLILLCMHGAKHNWGRLAWIADVAELLRARRDLDWARILERASARGARRMVLLGLRLARDLLAADVPGDVAQRAAADPRARALAARVRDRLRGGAAEPDGASEDPLFLLACFDRPRDQARFLFDRLTEPTPWLCARIPLPRPLRFLYRAIRPIEVAGRYGLTRFVRINCRASASPSSPCPCRAPTP
ncbi:MAG: nucleotidyltransferase family protein [Planctomycetes bacterium]|nr:nucleotidyltransferase family protein [Planctomycetota bacterium]